LGVAQEATLRTMLLDLERSQVLDLLPVRSAESFARWLGLHPEVEVITRDRSSLYADGGRQGAPSAVQITDRFHLVSNLSEAVERDIQQLQIDARKAVGTKRNTRTSKDKETDFDRRAAPAMPASHAISATRRCRNYAGKVRLNYKSRRRSASRQTTVARWLNAPAFPERRIRSDRRRDQKLFRERRERGLQPSLTRTHLLCGRVSALLNLPPQTLSAEQKRHLDAFLRFCPKAHELRRFILKFRAMLRWRSAKKLGTWIKSAAASEFRFTAQFAKHASARDLEGGQTVNHNALEATVH